jgi:hypothetical protein
MNQKNDQWQQYIGSVWASLLFNHSLNCSGSIIEVGPGFTDKIGCGLAKLQFRGKIYVLEPNTVALEWVTNRYKTLLPNSTIIAVNSATEDACAMLPDEVDAVLMNHVLDDMILYAGLTTNEKQTIFSRIKPGEPCLSQVRYTWQVLLSNPLYLSTLSQKVLTNLLNLIYRTNARIVGISQYKSWFLLQNELNEADLIGKKLLCEMILKLGGLSVKDKDTLLSYDQHPEDWLVIDRGNTYPMEDYSPGYKKQPFIN